MAEKFELLTPGPLFIASPLSYSARRIKELKCPSSRRRKKFSQLGHEKIACYVLQAHLFLETGEIEDFQGSMVPKKLGNEYT